MTLKRLINLIVAVLALQAVLGFSQATVVFQNSEINRIKQPNGITDPMLHNLRGYAQLAYAPAGTPILRSLDFDSPPEEYYSWLADNPGWLFAVKSQVTDGLFDGGTVTLEGIAPGSSISYSIFAWGPYKTVEECYYNIVDGSWGYSGPYTTLVTQVGAAPVSLAPSFREMVLTPPGGVPEPSALTIAALGGFVTFIQRRQSRKNRPCPVKDRES